MKNLLSKYHQMPVPVKAAFWLTICSLLQKGISIFTVPIFSRLLTTSEYGTVSVFVSWQNICILFTGLSLSNGIFNSAMIQYEDRHKQVVSSYLGLSTVLTVCFFVLYILFHEEWDKLLGMDGILMTLLFLHLLFAPAFNLWMAQQRFEYKYKVFVIVTLAISLLMPAVGIICVLHSENRLMARVFSMTIVECMFYAVLFLFIFLKGKTFYHRDLWKNAIIVNVPLIPHFLSGTVLNQADRIMIHNMSGASQAGIYSVAYSAAMLLQIVISSINSSIVPWFYKKMKRGKADETRGILSLAAVLMAGAVITFMLFAPECMKLLAAPEYYEAIWIFPPLTASVFYIFVYNLFCNVELYYEKSIYITAASCAAAGLNIVLNYFAIPVFGYMAAGYTTLISYICYAIVHYFCMKDILKKKSMENPIDIKFIVVLSALVLVASFAINLTYGNWVLRYGFMFLVLIVLHVNRGKIVGAIRELKR